MNAKAARWLKMIPFRAVDLSKFYVLQMYTQFKNFYCHLVFIDLPIYLSLGC